MAFNHYAKIAKIYLNTPNCRIIKINKPTKTKRFDGSYNFILIIIDLLIKTEITLNMGSFNNLTYLQNI